MDWELPYPRMMKSPLLQLYSKKFEYQLHTNEKQEADFSLDKELNKEHTPVKASLNQSGLLQNPPSLSPKLAQRQEEHHGLQSLAF